MMLKKWSLSIGVLSAVTTMSAYAEFPEWEDWDDLEIRPIGSISGGIAINDDAGKSGDYHLGVTSFHYETDTGTQTRGMFGGFLGLDLSLMEDFYWQTGVGYYQTGPFGVNGHVRQGITPETSDTFPYTYEILTRQLLWENKLLWEWEDDFYPYFLVGIGAAFNSARDFTVHDSLATFSPTYNEKRESSFTYSLGVGLDYEVHEHVRVGIGYRFTDLGKAELGDGHLGTPEGSIPAPGFSSQSHLYTNEFLAQLIFLM